MNKEDLSNLQVFLARVQLNGNEAMTLVQLQVKIAEAIKALPVEPDKIKKEIKEKTVE